jgi:hypothetical protein
VIGDWGTEGIRDFGARLGLQSTNKIINQPSNFRKEYKLNA